MKYTCEPCQDHGYHAFTLTDDGRRKAEIQRCDACADIPDDDVARMTFVIELERGVGYAQDQCETLVKYGGPER